MYSDPLLQFSEGLFFICNLFDMQANNLNPILKECTYVCY